MQESSLGDEERQDDADNARAEQQPQQMQNDNGEVDANNAVGNENEKQVTEHEASSEAFSPPTCRLVMVLYGDQGKTQPLFLGDNEAISELKFQPGTSDRFIVSQSANVYVVYVSVFVVVLVCSGHSVTRFVVVLLLFKSAIFVDICNLPFAFKSFTIWLL